MEGFWAAIIVAILSLVGSIVGNVLAHSKTTAVFEVEHRHLAEKVGENKDAIKENKDAIDENREALRCIDGRVVVLERAVKIPEERK